MELVLCIMDYFRESYVSVANESIYSTEVALDDVCRQHLSDGRQF